MIVEVKLLSSLFLLLPATLRAAQSASI